MSSTEVAKVRGRITQRVLVMILQSWKPLNVHFTTDCLASTIVKFRGNGCFDVIVRRLIDVISMEVLKFNRLVDAIFLKMLLLAVDVGGNLEDTSLHAEVHELWTLDCWRYHRDVWDFTSIFLGHS